MSVDGGDKHCNCGMYGSMKLHLVSSIVRDIGEPCLHQSSLKVTKTLKPEKWQAAFDSDGKVGGFHKALKLIILGGVDPVIRPEVWEFLLGCYSPDSTAEYRKQLRIARRERYRDLIRQCQTMHSSVGTGTLAYAVGSKVLDMRSTSQVEERKTIKTQSSDDSFESTGKVDMVVNDSDINGTGLPYIFPGNSYNENGDLPTAKGTPNSILSGSSHNVNCLDPYVNGSFKFGREMDETENVDEIYFDFPHFSISNMFEEQNGDTSVDHEEKCPGNSDMSMISEEDSFSFRVGNIESEPSTSSALPHPVSSEIQRVSSSQKLMVHPSEQGFKAGMMGSVGTSSFFQRSQVKPLNEDRVSDWLWTLHQIVVDVVRTDSHLEFYEDIRNLARMSDILAVYAWVDPETGYCQGMSDLLSPFVVLYEDNADAFWCFEMLLRRMRGNFQTEGPTAVMNQLQMLLHILQTIDRDMFIHLSHIGAESLHFAFRMLLVLFRRELSFEEALSMWEMMWAADFEDSAAMSSEKCLEPLLVHIKDECVVDETVNLKEDINDGGITVLSPPKQENVQKNVLQNVGMKSTSTSPLCGLAKNLWSKPTRLLTGDMVSLKSSADELPIFCVAAILIMNRHKILRETHSMDDLIKIFNDNILKIKVKRCVRTAIKLRKRYIYKLIRNKSLGTGN